MVQFKMLKLSVGGVVARFYLMMAVIIFAGFVGAWWLALLSLPIFFSTIMGVKIGTKENNPTIGKVIKMDSGQTKAAM